MKSFDVNPIVNIVRAEVVTCEEQPRVLSFGTVSSAEPKPFVSEGEEKELRVGNCIVAQDRQEDIIKGYDITLKDCALSRELLEVIDGGSARAASADCFAGYSAPVAGAVSERVRFTLSLYAEEKDYGGDSVAYFRFIYPNCVGTPCRLSFENGSFMTPEYVVRSRPNSGNSALTIQCMDNLPVYCAAANDAPATPKEGDLIMATGDITVSTLSLSVGELGYYNGTGWVKLG